MAIYGGVQFPEPEILVIPFELMRVASGNPVAVRTSDGQEVTLRLYSAQEFYDYQHSLVADGSGEPVSMARAAELTAPLDV